ncbi:hypothetical protein Fmac_019089 [Flemingia macrophylla]|uniref:Receptor-like serine/threonine-protein kinase n=1 Tax=Flemingia macrophylla TaxID=520843 RepID=A0ABD1M6T1_9FABA
MEGVTLLLFGLAMLNNLAATTVRDIIKTVQPLNDGQIIVSAGETFALGFFSPGNSKNRYVGIWYHKIPIQTLVWIANRDNPLADSSGVLMLNESGVLALLNHNKSVIWSSNSSRSAKYPVAKLLDTGNFIVQDGNNNNDSRDSLWQSFDHPVDTVLPGQKLGRSIITGLNWYLSSWNNSDDPSQGIYNIQVDTGGYPQFVLREGTVKIYRFGPWNGIHSGGSPLVQQNSALIFTYVSNEEETYVMYDFIHKSTSFRMVLATDGNFKGVYWSDEENGWAEFARAPVDVCDSYEKCGAYASCNINNAPLCDCLDGFVQKTTYTDSDCVRRTSLSCHGDGFLKFSGLKLPDTERSWFDKNISLMDCSILCMKNCSCTAYAALDISKGTRGCLLWFNDLTDIKKVTEVDQDIYIRMAGAEVGERHANSIINEHDKEDVELPILDLSEISSATNNFSSDNKLGQGGFGSVYKGTLNDGREIAVKRLSENSRQGLQEFKNEVMHIAKLQHRNLVRLLGCCIQAGERLLVYEFMPNKSLDSFIFDEKKSMLLDWPRRLVIINGIARGLLYLHQDSRHRIVHRDLKAGNVLLDSELNPKISDFGLARSFGGNETGANTNHVVGTYGYMPPEYIFEGAYSTKLDVFSFGVLILEIVCGKRNRGFYHEDNLLGHAWRLFTEGKCCEIVDATIKDSLNLSAALRAIHVGLLCVQLSPDDRPNMSSVVLMLTSESALPQPKVPGFFTNRNVVGDSSSPSTHNQYSNNEMTVSLMSAR